MNETMDRVGTLIKKNAIFKGIINTPESVKICGNYIGEIFSAKTVFIDSTAKINGDISAENIIVHGSVRGNLIAKNKIHLSSTCKLEGDIYAPNFIIENGVMFWGKCAKKR